MISRNTFSLSHFHFLLSSLGHFLQLIFRRPDSSSEELGHPAHVDVPHKIRAAKSGRNSQHRGDALRAVDPAVVVQDRHVQNQRRQLRQQEENDEPHVEAPELLFGRVRVLGGVEQKRHAERDVADVVDDEHAEDDLGRRSGVEQRLVEARPRDVVDGVPHEAEAVPEHEVELHGERAEKRERARRDGVLVVVEGDGVLKSVVVGKHFWFSLFSFLFSKIKKKTGFL